MFRDLHKCRNKKLALHPRVARLALTPRRVPQALEVEPFQGSRFALSSVFRV